MSITTIYLGSPIVRASESVKVDPQVVSIKEQPEAVSEGQPKKTRRRRTKIETKLSE